MSVIRASVPTLAGLAQLEMFVSIALTRYVERPDVVSRPGGFHIRHVCRADMARLFEIAAQRAAESR
jgi:hypothetical protein